MSDELQKNIRSIYSELQGYLAQAPSLDKAAYLRDSSLWEQLNSCIDELQTLTKENYSKFKLSPQPDDDSQYVLNTEYRSKLNGLIMRLHGKYFANEQTPFSGSPSTVVSQTQAQIQSAQVSILLEFQSFIDKKLYSAELKEDEKSFLQKIKNNLPTVKTTIELVNLILQTARSLGLDIGQVIKLFS